MGDEEYKKKYEEMQERIKKLEKQQKSFCEKCGSKLPKSNWSFSGYGECPTCNKKRYIRA